MECNKDEALRAKSIAEDKTGQRDFAGAKKFALKAQTLYPGLDGIVQMLTTLDVYISADSNKLNGEIDWYSILGVTPSADDEIIRKQYRKLALILHPDKNKSIGADGAFKLVSEAWSLLSDKAKRLVYNQKRGFKGPMHSRKMPHRRGPPPSRPRTTTFWTLCRKCMMHYEYLRRYRNMSLICPNCNEAFTALETPRPFDLPSESPNHVPGRTSRVQGQNGQFTHPHYQHDQLLRQDNVGSTDPVIAAKAANVVQQAQNRLKRLYTESGEEKSCSGMSYDMSHENGGFGNTSGARQGSRVFGFSSNHTQPNSTRDLTPFETRKMLMVKAKNEILNKVKMWRSETKQKVNQLLLSESQLVKGSTWHHPNTPSKGRHVGPIQELVDRMGREYP